MSGVIIRQCNEPNSHRKKTLPHASEHLSVFYCLIRSNDEGANASLVKPLSLPLSDRQVSGCYLELM